MRDRRFIAVVSVGLIAVLGGIAIAQTEQAPAPAPAQALAPDTVVAVVNGSKVTRADVIASAENLPDQYRAQLDLIFPALIERQVDLTLLTDEGRKQNLQDDPEVKAQIARATDDALRNALLRNHIEKGLTEAAIKARYDRFAQELPPKSEVRASHILVENEEDAKAIIVELEGGADFATLAKSKSKDPSAAQNGGDLGYFTAEQMVPEFSQAAFALDKGAIAKAPVKSQFGWHVIKVEDKREGQPPTLEEARPQVEELLSGELVSEYIAGLRSAAKIETFNPDGTPKVAGEAQPQ